MLGGREAGGQKPGTQRETDWAHMDSLRVTAYATSILLPLGQAAVNWGPQVLASSSRKGQDTELEGSSQCHLGAGLPEIQEESVRPW